MREIFSQLRDTCPICGQNFGLFFLPFGDEDKEKAKSFKPNQVVRTQVYGFKKERSLIQLHLYWAACGVVAELVSDHENIFDKDDVDFEVKIRVAKKKPALIRRFKVVSGMTYMEPISTSFKNMEHLRACKFYDLAMLEMSKMCKMSVEDLVALAKSKMKSTSHN